jgi:hypothetical protein
MESRRNQVVAALATAFVYEAGQMASLSRDSLDNPRRFGSAEDFRIHCPRGLSIANRQLDTGSFVDLVNGIEALPTTERTCD